MSDEDILAMNEAAEPLGAWPFFFADELRSWGGRKEKNQVLWGGRGTGKSVFLKVASNLTFSSTYVSGRGDWEAALNGLRKYGEHAAGKLFVDDIDRLVFRSRGSRDAAEELQRAIELAAQKAREYGCLVSSTTPLDEVFLASDPVSLFFQSFYEFGLEWWKKDWDQILGRPLKEQKLAGQSTLQVELGGSRRCLSADQLAGWAELTGGHPFLVGAGMNHLVELVTAGNPCGKPDPGSKEVLLSYMEAHLLRYAMGRVRKLLHALECGNLDAVGMPTEVQRRAWAAARELAQLPPGEGMQLSMKVAQTLERAGLVIPNSEILLGKWSLPGSLLRAEIAPEERKLAVTVVPSRELPVTQGTLVVVTNSETIQVELSGAPWRVIRALVARMPETVPISSLMEACEFETSLALRSALKRLRDNLAQFGVERVIKNEWGAGYRVMPLGERSTQPRPATL
jgi:hypothetical protein